MLFKTTLHPYRELFRMCGDEQVHNNVGAINVGLCVYTLRKVSICGYILFKMRVDGHIEPSLDALTLRPDVISSIKTLSGWAGTQQRQRNQIE